MFAKLRALRAWLPLVALVFLVAALAPSLGEAGAAWRLADGRLLGAAFLICLVYRWINAGVWGWILESLGHPLAFARAADIWLMSESLRWLPGGLWGFAARVDAARVAGVSWSIATVSVVVELAVTVAAWGALALVTGTGVWTALAARLPAWVPMAALACVPAGVLLVVVVARRSTRVADGLKALWVAARHRPGALVRSLVAYLLLNAVNGLCFWLVLKALQPDSPVSPGMAVAANAAGWLVGFFSFAVPGGIGVRELGSAALLATVIPWEQAGLAALVWRLVQIAAEVASLGVPLSNRLRLRKRVAAASTD